MSGRKYYCFCESNCKFETMNKEQILAAIAQAAETGMVIDEDAAFITKVKESNAGGMVTFWVGTQAQYNRLQSVDKNCLYIITDSNKDALLDAKLEEIKNIAEASAQMILLWESSESDFDSTFNFITEKISVDLSKYTQVVMQFDTRRTISTRYGRSASVILEKTLSIGTGAYCQIEDVREGQYRIVSVNRDGVEFEKAGYYSDSSNLIQDDSALWPYRIYGIK